jgi:hypothetical protein
VLSGAHPTPDLMSQFAISSWRRGLFRYGENPTILSFNGHEIWSSPLTTSGV